MLPLSRVQKQAQCFVANTTNTSNAAALTHFRIEAIKF